MTVIFYRGFPFHRLPEIRSWLFSAHHADALKGWAKTDDLTLLGLYFLWDRALKKEWTRVYFREGRQTWRTIFRWQNLYLGRFCFLLRFTRYNNRKRQWNRHESDSSIMTEDVKCQSFFNFVYFSNSQSFSIKGQNFSFLSAQNHFLCTLKGSFTMRKKYN